VVVDQVAGFGCAGIDARLAVVAVVALGRVAGGDRARRDGFRGHAVSVAVAIAEVDVLEAVPLARAVEACARIARARFALAVLTGHTRRVAGGRAARGADDRRAAGTWRVVERLEDRSLARSGVAFTGVTAARRI